MEGGFLRGLVLHIGLYANDRSNKHVHDTLPCHNIGCYAKGFAKFITKSSQNANYKIGGYAHTNTLYVFLNRGPLLKKDNMLPRWLFLLFAFSNMPDSITPMRSSNNTPPNPPPTK
jgi:hypothetical protein